MRFPVTTLSVKVRDHGKIKKYFADRYLISEGCELESDNPFSRESVLVIQCYWTWLFRLMSSLT